MSIKGFIYLITNDLNDKVYIGQTVGSLKKRFNEHCYFDSRNKNPESLDYAIATLGSEHFNIRLLEICDRDALDEREKYWISYYDSYNKGYNLTHGGQKECYALNNEQIEALLNDYMNGLSLKELGNKYNICESTVSRIVDASGVPKKTELFEEFKAGIMPDLITDYQEGMTNNELEEKYGISHDIYYRYFKKNNIPLRGSNTETCKQWSRENFKKATEARQVAVHNKTLDVYYSSKKEALISMIEQGYSRAVDWHNIRAPLDKALKNPLCKFLGFKWEIVKKE